MIKALDFEKGNGLLPVIIQDYQSKEIYMLGYMNEEAFRKTGETNVIHFWSRTRKKIWRKGEQSGNTLQVVKMYKDCDSDTLLVMVKLLGKNVCHTGNKSCFFTKIKHYESK